MRRPGLPSRGLFRSGTLGVAILALLLLGPAGCATVRTRMLHSYGETKTVFPALAHCGSESLKRGEPVVEHGVADQGSAIIIGSLYFCGLLIDFATAAVFDTILYPWDAYTAAEWAEKERRESAERLKRLEVAPAPPAGK